MIPEFLALVTVGFLIINLTPGDPLTMLVGESGSSLSPQLEASLRHTYGLDLPLPQRWFVYMVQLFSGNLGNSIVYSSPVLTVIQSVAFNSLVLMIPAMIIGLFLGVYLGVVASKRPYSKLDQVIGSASVVGYSIPSFWLGLILIIVFGGILKIAPISGMTSVGVSSNPLNYTADVLSHMVLPLITLILIFLPVIQRLTRSNMLEALGQDYIVMARSKGLSERSVLYKHALRNVWPPIITYTGVSITFLITGSILVETVFGWPGLGRMLYTSVLSRDYPVVMGIFVILSIAVIVVQFLVDIAYAYLDPRIRY